MTKREQNLAQIRDRATEHAERIIFDNGIDALSARRLAQDIGVSVGSLYNAFGDLDAVLRAVISRSAVRLSEILQSAVQAGTCKRSRLVALGEAYLHFAVSEPQRWWLLFEYKSHAPPDQKVRDFQHGLLDMLIHAGEGDPGSDQHRQVFLSLWASVHGLVALACRPAIVAIEPVSARDYIGHLVEAGINALQDE